MQQLKNEGVGGDASDDAWETVKETADKVWNDLGNGLTSTVSKFK
jgi:hypothetical protein